MTTHKKVYGYMQCTKCNTNRCRKTPIRNMPCTDLEPIDRKHPARVHLKNASWTELVKARIRLS